MAAGEGTAGAERLLRNVRSFCSDSQERIVQLAAILQEPAEPADAHALDPGSYNMLRQSLSTTQRRCAALSEDMLRVADANEELMSAMQTVKVTNRRLVDQIQSQSDEINKLTQQRLRDEGRCEELAQQHKSEAALWQKELEGRIEEVERACRESFDARRAQLVDKLRCSQPRLRNIASEVAGLRGAHAALAAEAKVAFAEWNAGTLEPMVRGLVERLNQQLREDQTSITQLEDEVHAKGLRLSAERDTRQREDATWRTRDAELSDERRALADRVDAEAARLRESAAAAEAARELERRELLQDRSERSHVLQDLAVKAASLRAMVSGAHGVASALNARVGRDERERQEHQDAWLLATQKLKDSDAALDWAVAANEELRQQMEAQRAEAQATSAAAMDLCREQFNASFARQQTVFSQEIASLEAQVESAEAASLAHVTEISRLRLKAERHAAERTMLQRDCALWRAQNELAEGLRVEVEREFKEVRDECIGQLRVLRENQDVLAKKQLALEEELRSAQDAAATFDMAADKRAVQTRSRTKLLGSEAQDAEQTLRAAKRDLQEKHQEVAKLRLEASTKRAGEQEQHRALESRLQQLEEEAWQRREELTMAIANERQKGQKALSERSELEQKRQRLLHDTQSGPLARMAALEQEIRELRERGASERRQMELKLEGGRGQIASLEHELDYAQSQLNEAEQRLQADTSLLRGARSEHTAALEQLKEELSIAKRKAEQMRQQEARAAEELGELQRQAAQARAAHEAKLVDLGRCQEQQSQDAERRLDIVRKQHAAEQSVREERMRAELRRQQQTVDAAEAENLRLRRLIGEARGPQTTASATTGASFLQVGDRSRHGEVQETLERMRQRTELLRWELGQRGRVATAPVA